MEIVFNNIIFLAVVSLTQTFQNKISFEGNYVIQKDSIRERWIYVSCDIKIILHICISIIRLPIIKNLGLIIKRSYFLTDFILKQHL